ncbi:hypothetical protein ACR77J_07200 [Tissierella praeacuta]|uniref:hypothetical protein n=1 Tax=Tissierella praeacuta TaxID=43131 RepID=UPI003DA37DC7
MNNKHTFLTYNTWKDEEILLSTKELSPEEIQLAIDGYKMTKDQLERDNIRLNKMVDNLLNELKYYKDFKMKYDEKYSSGY